jgi:glycosyltransferase involved in cell wall biosynthesis
MLISIVVPCYNEEAGLAELHRRLTTTCAALAPDYDYEIVLVDDGSRDSTADRIEQLAADDPHVRGIMLSRNFGHQAALTAGIDHAEGHAVIVMDADLQHPPDLIPAFLEKWRQGFDIVYGFRRNRRPRLGYRLINALMKVTIPPEAADFRLMDRRVVDAFRNMPERHRFIRGMLSWLGFKQIGLPYEDAERFAGPRSYTIRQTLRMALDAVLSFSMIPLRLASILGLLTLLLGLAYAVFILVSWIVGRPIEPGWTGMMMTILILGGVQLLCLGIIAEYLGRVYEETKHRPLYIIRQKTQRPKDA